MDGSSLVDYVLADYTTLSQIRYFCVDKLIGDLSDHCKISFGLAVNVNTHQSNRSVKVTKVPRKFKWNAEADTKIKSLLSTVQYVQEINKLTQQVELHGDEPDKLASSVNSLILNVASKCLKRTSNKSTRKGKKNGLTTHVNPCEQKSGPWQNCYVEIPRIAI